MRVAAPNKLKTESHPIWEQCIFTGNELASAPNNSDTRLLADKIKHHHFMFNELYLKEGIDLDNATRERMLHTMHDLEAMYPINKNKYASVWDLYSSFKGKGIVMTAGSMHFRFAFHGISFLRRIGCKLPIEIFYNGPGDLKNEMIDFFKTVPGVSVIDASRLLSPHLNNSIGGWAIKPFAMLMSSFKEFIFIDADVLFFQNPEILFNYRLYRNTGTLYFRDRTIPLEEEGIRMRHYFKKMVKDPSEYAKSQRFWLNLTAYEGESGVIVMDKKKGGAFVLMLASLLNMDPFKDDLYAAVHGDKESYWMANEALGVPYSWSKGAGGAIGHQHPFSPYIICGHLFHVDENWNPLWFNGGLILNKLNDLGKEVIYGLTHYAIDRTMTKLKWEWESASHPFCLLPENPIQNTGQLPDEFSKIGKMMLEDWVSLNTNIKGKNLT